MSTSESFNQQTIKPRGTIQNMLNQGFSDRACISENIDDSLGANATQIRIFFDTKTRVIYHIDDGVGMNKEACFEAHCLNSRKDKSKKRQGRFGIGRKQAQAVMNNLESSTKTLTKCEVSETEEDIEDSVIELEINWKECIEKDIYQIVPHGVSSKSLAIWKKYAIDPKKTGTITIIPCSKKIFDSLLSQARTKIIQDSLNFQIGRTYFKYIEEGVVIELVIDGEEIPIVPMNPLLPHFKVKDTRCTHKLAIFGKEDAIRVYYKNEKNEDVFRDFSSSSTGKQNTEGVPNDWSLIGRLNFTCIYISQEYMLSCFGLDSSKYDIPTDEGQGKSGIQELRVFLCGSYYSRNGKVISRFNIPKATAGDKAHYKFIQDMVQFIEFDSDLDEHFDISVNKSKIEEMNITTELRKTLKFLATEFSRHMINTHCKCDTCTKPKAPVNPAPAPAPAPTPAPAPAPAPGPSIEDYLRDKAILENYKESKNQPTNPNPIVKKPSPKPAPKPAPPSIVGPFIREQSKSTKDILGLVMSFAERVMNSPNIEQLHEKASTKGQKGFLDHWNNLNDLEDMLREVGVTLEGEE